jgi:HlyD family secretion protein
MKRTIFFLIFIFALTSWFSCNMGSTSGTMTFQVVPTRYLDELVLDGTVEAVNSISLSCPEIYDVSVYSIVDEGVMVKKGDTVCVLESKMMVDQYENALKNLERIQAEFKKSQADLDLSFALMEAQVKNNEAQTAISDLDSLQLRYSSEAQRKITELQLKIARIEKNKLQKKLNSLKIINASELRKLNLRIKQSENQVEMMSQRMKLLIIIAPQDGLALRGYSPMGTGKLKEGDVVYEGMPLVEIPDLTRMRVKIVADESSYKRIQVGQKVHYTFDAMPGNIASGTISMKTPVGNPINRNSKVKFFDIIASIDSSQTLPGPGLSANCRVVVQEFNDTLVVPNVTVFEEDTIKVVYVKLKTGFERREIALGPASSSNSIITAGLDSGEFLAMVKPSNNLIKKEKLFSFEERNRWKPTNGNKKDSMSIQHNIETTK